MTHLWGIDLGGTKIEGVILDRDRPGEPVCRLRLPTEGEKGYEHIVSQIAEVCRMLSAKSGLALPEHIGMGTPGVINATTGLLTNSNTQCLNNQPLQLDVERKLGNGFVLANDANCFALAEATYGSAKGHPTVFGIILGTGVGGGIVANGKILEGRHGIAGEWGQIVLDPQGPLSKYGTGGTIEAIIAGPALESFYESRTGRKVRLRQIADTVDTDAEARATIDRLTDNFARALTVIVDVLDPHAIVIGGGVGNIDELYSEATRAKIASHIFYPSFDAALLKPTLGDSAGVFGAAMLVA